MIKRGQINFSKSFGCILLAIVIFEIVGIVLVPPRHASAIGADDPYLGQTTEGKAETATGKKAAAASPTSGAPCQSNITPYGLVTGTADFVCAALIAVNALVDGIFYIPFALVEYFFSWALESNINIVYASHPIQFAVRVGYPIVLGVANMFFVLILLWIAVATIFDFEPYTARSLLLTLIITALLINFSQPIAKTFIGLSNGLTNIFYRQLIINNDAHSIRGAIQDLFLPADLVKLATAPAEGVAEKCKGLDAKACSAKIFETTAGEYVSNGVISRVTAAECEPAIGPPLTLAPDSTRQATCAALVATADAQSRLIPQDPRGLYWVIVMSIAWKIVIYPIAIFVLFAATILLVTRVIVLAFVLILGPAAFLMNILPSTKFLNKMWWDNLIKYSFFFPTFMFFFWLGIVMAQKIPGGFYQEAVAQKATDIYSAMAAYLLSAAFMIGALIAASKFGTSGAATVTGWGKKMSKAAGKWTTDRGWKYVGRATGVLAGAPVIGKVIGRLPPLRAGATAVMTKGAGVEKKDIGFYTKLPDKQLSVMLSKMGPGLRAEIIGALPSNRKNKFTQGGQLISSAPPAPTAAPVTPQQIQAQVLPIVQGLTAIQNLPQAVQQAITQAVTQVIQQQPAGASAATIATAVQNAVSSTVQVHPAAPLSQIQQVQTAVQQPQTTQQIRASIQQVQQPRRGARAAGPQLSPLQQVVGDLESQLEELRSDISDLKEKGEKTS